MSAFLVVFMILLVPAAFVAGALVGHSWGWVDWRVIEAVRALEKALRAGYHSPVTAEGVALKVEDLSAVMKLVTFESSHIAMFEPGDDDSEF